MRSATICPTGVLDHDTGFVSAQQPQYTANLLLSAEYTVPVQLRGAKYKDGSIVRNIAISLDGELDYESSSLHPLT